jgi:hypothetical protein
MSIREVTLVLAIIVLYAGGVFYLSNQDYSERNVGMLEASKVRRLESRLPKGGQPPGPTPSDPLPERDSFGNPYRIGTQGGTVFVYSCGRDGISLSQGQDPDDITSLENDQRFLETYRNDFLPSKNRWILILAGSAHVLVPGAILLVARMRRKKIGSGTGVPAY